MYDCVSATDNRGTPVAYTARY